jgi:hypothetical protein|tara:strand:- start:6943 stop:7116 length:174 start_codon:yes stop_codon:yes gene_type:complete
MLVVGMAETGRVHDGVEGSEDEEEEKDGAGDADGSSDSDEDRVLRNLSQSMHVHANV